MAMVATDRISAFDVILPKPIPGKGAVLNQLASFFLKNAADIVPNWLEETPDPNVSFGKVCQPVAIEMVIRGYLVGHAWREYSLGKRTLCGVALPEGLRAFDPLPNPIITPSTKASQGHDEDISKEEILAKGLISKLQFEEMEDFTYALFARGQEMAEKQGLILADSKYEFGFFDGKLMLMDEIHTPDSSRYYYAKNYFSKIESGEKPEQLSKEFVREWLMENGFMGKDGQQIPEMTESIVNQISNRYIHLFKILTGRLPTIISENDIASRIEKNIFGILNRQAIVQ